jgi:hypothetical protein
MLTTTFKAQGCVFAAMKGMDPFADWLLGPGIHDFVGTGELPLVPCLVHFDQSYALGGLAEAVFIPRFSGQRAERCAAGAVMTALAPPDFMDRLLADGADPYLSLRGSRTAVVLGSPIHSATLAVANCKAAQQQPVEEPDIGPPECGWPDGTVIMGVIDDGIAFANDRFRRKDGSSRVMCFWQQGLHPRSATVPFGQELLRADIDDLLQRWTRGGGIDEAGLYAEAGLASFARPGHKAAARRAAHGTHVLDLAAGAAMADDECRRPIIGVELPTHAVADTSFRLLAPAINAAVEYIVARALKLAGETPLPVVIAISYGMHAGPHDGTHPLEEALEQHVGDYPGELRIILPAGNHHLERGHAIVDFDEHGDEVDLPLRLVPDDRTPSFVEVWLPSAPLQAQDAPPPDRVRLALIPPRGLGVTDPPPVLGEQQGAALEITDEAGDLVARACYRFVPTPTARGVFAIAFQPTTRLRPEDATPGVAPAGLWTLRLSRAEAGFSGPVDVRIQRDDAAFGYPIRGRQAYFDHPAYARFDRLGRPLEADDSPEQAAAGKCPVKRRGSLNAIATSKSVIVAGGFRRRFEDDPGPIAPYSPGEPVTAPAGGGLPANTRKPDAVLPSDDSKVQAGILAAGTASGSRVAFSGTSVAAPQLAREIASWLAQGDPAQRAQVRTTAMADTEGLADAARSGWGRITPPPFVRLSR